jgi:predicted metal-binding membrane protein
MANIFELTKREQRVVILIVTMLVVIALAKHLWQSKSQAATTTSQPSPTATPSTHQ